MKKLKDSGVMIEKKRETYMITSQYLVSLLILIANLFTFAQAKSTDANHSAHAEGTRPEVALKWLKNGNTRFVKGHLRNDGARSSDVKRLSTGQTPHSIVLSCSDSRVPPEVVFDQKLGEIFTVRTAGEAIDPSAIASMEYAVEHLGSRNLVVMGHTNCGAVKAALSTLNGADAGSKNLNHLVHDLHPRLMQFKESTEHSKNYEKESWANVEGIIKDLKLRSPELAKRISSGELTISPALYHLETGVVQFK